MYKKIFSLLLCFVLLLSVLSVPAHAEVLTLTSVSVAVLATGLLAAGVAVATDQDFRAAASAMWADMSENMKQNIKNVAVVAGYGGTLVASWTAAQWHTFTDWVKAKFAIDGTNSIPIEFGKLQNVNTVTQLTWDNVKVYKNLSKDIGFYDISIASSSYGEAVYRASWSTTGSMVQFITPCGATFSSSASYSLNDYGVTSVNAFKPYLLLSETSNNFVGIVSLPITSNFNNLGYSHRTMLSDWVLGNTGTAYDGQSIRYDANSGRILVGSTYVTGTFTGIADYIYKCCIGAGVIGLPIYGDDVIGIPETDEGIGVDVYPQYYPDVGELSPSVPIGTTMDIDIPTTELEDGTLTPDIDGVRDLTPDQVIPKIRTGDITDGTITDDKVKDFPIEDVTVPDIPVDNPIEDNKNARKFKFPTLATKKFPFSIPFDFVKGVRLLLAPAEVPEFDYTFSFPRLGINETIHLDLSEFDGIAKVSRWFFSALFIIFLIFATKKLIWS